MASTLSPPDAATRVRTRPLSMGYLPGLDGLRALSVVVVLLYHARDVGIEWLPEGGFLGVEVFFVISGYLITALLLAEYRNSLMSRPGIGRINLGQFWLRRARRLLPALYLLLVTVSVYWFVVIHDELYRLRGDVLAAVTYVTNWYLVFSQQSYFEQAGRPSPFRHLWSLAVEEQFYLLWPIILFGLLVVFKGHRGRILAVIGLGIVASTLAMAWMYEPGTDPSRVYYGTDTRAAGLLIGAALAFLLPPWHLKRRTGPHAHWVIDGIGVASLLALAWFFVNTNEFDPFLYQGGFALLSVVTAVAIAVAAHPASYLGRHALGFSLLTWIGVRSYGIYLWHWPIYQITRPDLDLPIRGYPLLFLRFALTFVLAALSYRFVEAPIRKGAIGAWLARYGASRGEVRASLVRKSAFAGAGGVIVAMLLVAGFASARPSSEPQGFVLPPDDPTTTVATTTVAPTTLPAVTAAPGATVAPGVTAAPATVPPTQATPPPAPYAGVFAIGDSVMLGAKAALEQRMPGLAVDAAVNRQVKGGAELIDSLRAQGRLGRAVVIHLGTNGVTTQEQFDHLMATLQGVPRVVLINTKVPRPWESRVNGQIADTAAKYPNVVLIDWKGQGGAHQEWFWNDGIHLRPAGAAAFAELIAQAVG